MNAMSISTLFSRKGALASRVCCAAASFNTIAAYRYVTSSPRRTLRIGISPHPANAPSRISNNGMSAWHKRGLCSSSGALLILEMPSLSPTMEKGNIASWNVKVGDFVEPGVILGEIETDKATMEYECQEEGFVAAILIGAGTRDVPVGQPVIVITEDEASVGKVDVEGMAAQKHAASVPDANLSSVSTARDVDLNTDTYPPHQVLEMPSLSPTMTEGGIASWNVKAGDHVQPGDVLGEITTDKASMEYETTEEGYVAAVLVDAGTENVSVGTPVIVLAEEETDIEKFVGFKAVVADLSSTLAPKSPSETQKATAADHNPVKGPTVTPPDTASPSGRIYVSPLARKHAALHGISLEALCGTGPNGRVLAADVDDAVTSQETTGRGVAPGLIRQRVFEDLQVAPLCVDEGVKVIPHTNIRRITATKLSEAKQTIPHFYLTQECKIGSMLSLRARLNAQLAANGRGKISVNDMIVKAASCALKEVPEVNAAFTPEEIKLYESVHISIALQTPVGLLVPVIRDADKLGLVGISEGIRTLSEKGKNGKISPEDMMGGTFTISNLGMFGIKNFSAIINPPQACILAVGATEEHVVPAADGQGRFSSEKIMSVRKMAHSNTS